MTLPDELVGEAEATIDNFVDEFTEEEAESAKEKVLNELESKARRYIENPEDAPEGAEVQTGPQDGLYYETEGEEGEESQEDNGVTTANDVEEYVENFLPEPSLVGRDGSRAKIGDGISSDWIEFERNTSTEALQDYFDTQIEEFQDNPLASVADEIKDNYSLRMIGGMLLSREDGNVSLDEVVEVYGESVVDETEGEISKQELVDRTEQVASSLNPVVSGSLFANVDRIEHAQEPIPGDARFKVMGTEDEYDGQKRVVEFNTFTSQSPAPVAHELGHALHYLMGINYASDTKNIKFGDREVRPPEEWEAGWDVRDEAGDVEKELFSDLDSEWDKFVQYHTEGSEGCEPLWYYQKANGHEFFSIAFAFWVGDREKLEEYQPGVASIFDDYFGDSE